jgi:hypothetical protein
VGAGGRGIRLFPGRSLRGRVARSLAGINAWLRPVDAAARASALAPAVASNFVPTAAPARADALTAVVGPPWSIAFYYGTAEPRLPLQLLEFDLAVVEPGYGFEPSTAADTRTRWLAYVSVGEVHCSRNYHADIPEHWIIGRNSAWQADIVDQGAPGWPAFFVERVIAPLWQRGYRGFFLDALDSYLPITDNDVQRERNRAGLVAVIRAIRERFANAQLILNRGFELLPRVHGEVYAIAFESLFKGWNERRREYVDVPPGDRHWLLEQAGVARALYGLPVIAIDYCPPEDVLGARDTVERIRSLGLVAYVGDGHLQALNLAAARRG